ncbi:DUF6708 domain-containing protein [Cupriavidus sp. 2SB]|uniref:DUF6708 domain-containing protein n=1 Tax=Cupriavidus sp. 2SB TaxID=2502199 RepID=UPI0010F81A6F|nr:DUF6708 domain-containing protein [Cupriavidus sp. 2SB]
MFVEETIAIGLKECPELNTSLPTGGMPHDEHAAERPISNLSVFKKNDTYLEVCGQFEAHRGLLGFALGAIPTWVIVYSISELLAIALDLVYFMVTDEPVRLGDYIFTLIFRSLILWAILWACIRFALPLIRRDYFTSRRTVIRFNRVTRKVYVHQPPHAGGIQIHDWDGATALLDDAVPDHGDGRLLMGWQDTEGEKATGLIFVGRAAGNAARGRAWWEYIRRYMEEGPHSVPRPRLRLWKGVWPHMSLLEIFYIYPERLIHGGPLWWLLLIGLAPIDLARAALHWLAMLLCIEPKFPPEIEHAGQNLPTTPSETPD